MELFLILGMFFFYVKNFNRIISNLDNNYKNAPWPTIYSMKIEEKNKKSYVSVISNSGKISVSEKLLSLINESLS